MLRSLLLGLCLAVPTSMMGQQRPFLTDEPETLPLGRVRASFGMEFLQGQRFPLSGLEGDLTRAGVTGIQVGIGDIAEFQISGVLQDFLSVTRRSTPAIAPDFAGNATSDFGDLVLGTKIRFAQEKGKRPGLGFKFAVQLPNASNERGLGTDETNFFAALLASKHLSRAKLFGEAGLAILGSAVQPNTQSDMLTYGFGIIVPVHKKISLVADIHGRHGPQRVGNENRSEVRMGLLVRAAGLRWDVAGIAGLGKFDADSGVALGITYEFQAFNRTRTPRRVTRFPWGTKGLL